MSIENKIILEGFEKKDKEKIYNMIKRNIVPEEARKEDFERELSNLKTKFDREVLDLLNKYQSLGRDFLFKAIGKKKK